MDLRNVDQRIESVSAIDRVADPVHRLVNSVLPRGAVKDALHGVWLGHPLHSLMTDLPIGFWTSAWVLDIVGGRKAERVSQTLVGLGIVTAVPTVAAGAADWSELGVRERRTGLVHALSNVAATALYSLSYLARRRGHQSRGVMLGMAGATAATVGGYLGGHLTYRSAAGVNAAADAPDPDDWTEVELEGALAPDAPTEAHLDDQTLAAVGGAGSGALYARCSHLRGPLQDGDLVDGCIRCPWHGSTFRVADGTVVRGPATAPQPAYELRQNGGRTTVRRRPPA